MEVIDKIFTNYCISSFIVLAVCLVAGNENVGFNAIIGAILSLTVALTILRW